MATYRGILAVDPGATHCAYAYFCREGKLQSCGYEEGTGRELAHRLAQTFPSWASLICERMQVYSGYKATDDNDLILVSETAGAIKAAFSESYSVTASRWKGQVPKEVTKKRVRDALGEELVDRLMCDIAPSKRNHVYDAIGIGIWFMRNKE